MSSCLIILLVALFAFTNAVRPPDPYPVAPGVQGFWGHHKPYKPKGTWKDPPEGCEIDRVFILERHGSRFPLQAMRQGIEEALARLEPVKRKVMTKDKGSIFSFLKTYKFELPKDDLIELGSKQSRDAGMEAWTRYGKYIGKSDDKKTPFVRASKRDRVVDSAIKWIEGYKAAGGSKKTQLNHQMNPGPKSTLIDSCPNQDEPFDRVDTWVNIYGQPIVEKLKREAKALGVSISIDPYHIYQLQSLCALESQDKFKFEDGVGRPAPPCDLFTETSEWQGYEYASDILKYYTSGYGQRLGKVRGVGWINELISRLTGNPVQDGTSADPQLYGNPATFPQDRVLYADLSHDDLMVAVYTAMGLFVPKAHLSDQAMDPKRTWKAGYLVPFAGRMIVERLDCTKADADEAAKKAAKKKKKEGDKKKKDGGEKKKEGGEKKKGNDNKKTADTGKKAKVAAAARRKRAGVSSQPVYTGTIPKNRRVRIFVADELQPQSNCGGKKVCKLDEFVRGQTYARSEEAKEDYKKCWAKKK